MKKCDSCKEMEWDLDLLRNGIVFLTSALVLIILAHLVGLPPKINCDECQNCILMEDSTGEKYYASYPCECKAETHPDCDSGYAMAGRWMHGILFGGLVLGAGICSIGTLLLFWMFVNKVRP